MAVDPRFVEVSAVAQRLGVSVATVYRHRNNPDSPLVFVQLGAKKGFRVTKESVDALVAVDFAR